MPEARVIPLRPDDDDAYVPVAGAPGWDEQVAGGLEVLRRRLTGEYETAEFGCDPHLTAHVPLPLLRPLFRKWFRVESQGLGHVPSTGGGVVWGHQPRGGPGDGALTPAARAHDPPA